MSLKRFIVICNGVGFLFFSYYTLVFYNAAAMASSLGSRVFEVIFLFMSIFCLYDCLLSFITGIKKWKSLI
jgi:hypothetical protein